jgi:Protein of unknown function (DUF3037)
MKHMYCVIRYVPDPIRGEFVNVGAIAGSDDSSEWEVRQVDNPARARRLDERRTLPAVWSFIDHLGRLVDAHEEAIEKPKVGVEALLSEGWLQDLYASHRNIVQLSPPAPIVAETAAEALDEVFAQLIVDPEPHRGGENTKHPALAAVRRAYREAGLAKNRQLYERVVVHAGDHRERLDFAVANGRVVQLTQTWSFRVVDQDALAESVRAWGWTIRAVKDGGGTISIGERELEVPSDVDLEVVVIPPPRGRGRRGDRRRAGGVREARRAADRRRACG